MFEMLRQIHITCALATGMLFVIRGFWMMMDGPKLKQPVIKIAPHVIDTVLLLSAMAMLVVASIHPFSQPWLLAKFVALLVYIMFGLLAFRFAPNKGLKILCWMLAVATLFCIYGFAMTKRVVFW